MTKGEGDASRGTKRLRNPASGPQDPLPVAAITGRWDARASTATASAWWPPYSVSQTCLRCWP